ncbi:thioesterase domain-containing protein [Actinosynnema sp. CA-299493]
MTTPVDTDYHRPRDPVELWLSRVWHDVLGFGVGIRENFFGIGGNSLDAARVINAVLTELDVRLPLNVMAEHPTVESLAAILREHDGRLAGPLVPVQDGDGTPLFLIHPDDGQVARYARLAQDIGEDYPVHGLQAPGLYGDAAPVGSAPADPGPVGSVPALARAYADEIRAAHPSGPYVLGGAGVGAVIAYEVAALLPDVRLVADLDPDLVEAGTSDVADPERALADWKARDLVPSDTTAAFVRRVTRVREALAEALAAWRPSPATAPVDVFGETANTWPDDVTVRRHQAGELTTALRAALR